MSKPSYFWTFIEGFFFGFLLASLLGIVREVLR